MTRQTTSWRTWSQTRPTMCPSPRSIQMNRRARIWWAPREHVRYTTQHTLCDNDWSITSTISVGSWFKARPMTNLFHFTFWTCSEWNVERKGYAHYTFLFLPLVPVGSKQETVKRRKYISGKARGCVFLSRDESMFLLFQSLNNHHYIIQQSL